MVRSVICERLCLPRLRVCLCVVGVASFFWSVRYLPLADAMTFSMAAPLFVTALSVRLLGERVGPRRWGAVFIGFCGVLMIPHPAGAPLTLPAVVALTGDTLRSEQHTTDFRPLMRTSYAVFC